MRAGRSAARTDFVLAAGNWVSRQHPPYPHPRQPPTSTITTACEFGDSADVVIYDMLCTQMVLDPTMSNRDPGSDQLLLELDVTTLSIMDRCSSSDSPGNSLETLLVGLPSSPELLFRESCERGGGIRRFVEQGVDIHADNEYGFRVACKNGHLYTVQRLFACGGVNIHAENDEGFRSACLNGHVAIVRWLHSLGEVTQFCVLFAFRVGCWKGYLEIAKWAYFLGEADTDIHAAFPLACKGGHLDVVVWLYSLGGINIHANDDNAKRSATHDVGNWLVSLDPEYVWP
jgi:hypothetical protein